MKHVRWNRAISGGVVVALLAVAPGPAYAVIPSFAAPPDDVDKARAAVESLAAALGAVGTLPQLATSLPLTGQSPTGVLDLTNLFQRSLGTAMQDFLTASDNESWSDLEKALDDASVDGLGIDATVTESAGTATVRLTLGGSSVDGDLYVVHAGATGSPTEDLLLDGTSVDEGAVPVTGQVSGSLVLTVDTDAPLATGASLSPTSNLRVAVEGANGALSLPSRYGFSDVTASGAASYDLAVALPFADPDGSGGITAAEWDQTLVADLVEVDVDPASGASVDLSLDSDLVSGVDDGALALDLAGADLVVSDNGDGTASYDDPTATFTQALRDLARVTPSDAIVGLAQLAAVYTTAQSRMDPRLPFADQRVSQLVDLAAPLNRIVEAQGAAAVVCGRTDTNPPAATAVPGSTWFCQARTADAVVPTSVQWSLDGAGTLGANATSADTVGQDPAKNVVVTGSATEPDISVSFDVADGDGAGVPFTAQRRVRTAQELEERLDQLAGSDVSVAYDATSRSLAFDVAISNDPDAVQRRIAVADLFRPTAHLRGVETDDTMSLDVGATTLDATLGLLLAPEGDDVGIADRAFLRADDGPELEIASLSGSASSFAGTGSVGFVPVDVAGTDLTLTSDGLSADVATGTLTAVEGEGGAADVELDDAALLSDVLADDVPGVSGSVLTGAVQAAAGATVRVSSDVLPAADAGTRTAALSQDVDATTPTDDLPDLPTITTDAAWDTWIAPLDVTPQVSGRSTGNDSDTTLEARGSPAFESSAFGVDLTGATAGSSERVIDATLFNLTSGASCPRFRVVSETTLTCVDVAEADGTQLATAMAGGKRPAANPDADPVPDNTWRAGDEFVVTGDPTTVRGLLLGGLVDLANGIATSTESSWNSSLPLVGLRPRDLTPQLAAIRDAAADVAAAPALENCGKQGGATSDACDGTQLFTPSDLDELRDTLQDQVEDVVTAHGGDADDASVTVEVTDSAPGLASTPHLVLEVSAPAAGTTDAPLSLPLGEPTGYMLRRSTIAPDATGTAKLPVTWSSTVELDLAVPLGLDVDPSEILVLPSTGVSDLRVVLDEEEVDLTGSLGPVNVDIGTSAKVTGAHQVVTGTTTGVVVDDATVTPPAPGANEDPYSSTTVLVDKDLGGQDFTARGVVAGDVVRTYGDAGPTGSCAITTVAADTLTCAVALTGGAVFEDGVAYRVLSADTVVDSTRSTNDPATATTQTWAFDDLVGQLAGIDPTGAPAVACAPAADGHTASTVACDAASGTGDVPAWDKGTAYTLDFGDPTDTLVQLGAKFDEQYLVGQPVLNVTDGSTCLVESATRDTLVCAAPLAGGTDNRWDDGDEWQVGGLGVAETDLSYVLNADVDGAHDPTVARYVAALAGDLEGPATARDCGDLVTADGTTELTGDACALLSVRVAPTGPDGDFPDGRFLGTIGYTGSVASGQGTSVSPTVTVTDGIEGLADSEVTLGFDLAGVAVEQLGAAVQSLLDGTVVDEPMPLLGYDATGGSWLNPVLDELSWQLDEALPNGEAPAGATVGDIGTGTGLAETIEEALAEAVDGVPTMLPIEGVEVGLFGDPDVTLTCGDDECADDARLGEVDDMNITFTVGENAVAGSNPEDGCAESSCGTAKYQVPFSVGLPGIPVQADFNVNSHVGWKMKIDVGVDRATGPYVGVHEDQLVLGAGVDIPEANDGESCPANPLGDAAFADGSIFGGYSPTRCQAVTLGILQATAFDAKGDDRSQLSMGLSLDLDKLDDTDGGRINAGQLALKTERDLLQRRDTVALEADGRIDWYFVTGVNPDIAGGLQEGSLPSVHGRMLVEWEAGGTVSDLTTPNASIEFDDLYLDAGSFVNEFAGPLVTDVSNYVKPYKPVIDTVRAPIPVLSDLSMMFGGAQLSLLDVLEGVSGNDLSLIRNVLDVLDIVASLQPVGKSILIPLAPSDVPEYESSWSFPSISGKGGSFQLLPKQVKSGPCGGAMTPVSSTKASQNGAQGVNAPGTTQSPAAQNQQRTMPKDCSMKSKGKGGYRSTTTVTQLRPCDPVKGCTGKELARSVTKWSNRPKLTGTALSFPFLDDPSEVFGMLVGEDATLVRLDLGTLQASAGLGISFGPFMAGPVPVDIGVGVSVTLGAHLALGYDTLGLRNALLDDPGTFQADRLLDGLYIDDYDAAGNETPEMFAVLTVQLEGSVSIKIFRAGVYGGVSLTIAGDLVDPNGDGKLRIQEIQTVSNPICLFGLSGYLEFFLGAFVQVDLFIKTLRYNFEFYRSPRIQLFDLKCAPEEPHLATVLGDGNLRLNIGPASVDRNLAESETRERYKVRQISALGAVDGKTRVSIDGFGLYQEFLVAQGNKIVGNGDAGNDTLEFLPGVDLDDVTHAFEVPVDVHGGEGDDVITSGDAADRIDGDGGNDRIGGGLGDDTVNGGEGNDTVSGGIGADVLHGDAGDDVVSGDAGGDTLHGDAGNDTLSGGPGLDATQLDRLVVRENRLRTQQGKPEVSASDAAYQALLDQADLVVGGAGDDTITGHVGADTLVGDDLPGSLTAASTGAAFRSAACVGALTGSTGNDSIDGQVGNDRIAGGPGDDSLTGGAGDDTVCGNEGDDLLEADEGATGASVGADDLRGGDGDDRLYGRSGGDQADGGAGSDLVDGGPGHDVLTGGLGPDALTGADGHDVVVGDGATVSGVTLGSTAGVSDLGILDTTSHGTALSSRVSSVTGSGSGSATVCAAQVSVRGGKLDLDGNGVVDAADNGRFDGFAVLAGQVDVDGNGTVDGVDSAVVAGLPVVSGKVDVPADQLVNGLAFAGTGDADCVLGLAGNDALFGGGAGDRIEAGVGDDHVDGGAGDDRIRGEQGDDRLLGGADDDEVYGDRGRDTMRGQQGDDDLYGGIDDDDVEGNQGDDLLSGGDGTDVLVGGSSTEGVADGVDRVDGGAGADLVAGDNAQPVMVAGVLRGLHLLDLESTTAGGDDVLRGGPDADVVHGQSGADTIAGEGGADRIEGGPGADVIDGGDADDRIAGGSGEHLSPAGDVVKLGGTQDGGDTIRGGAGHDTIVGDNARPVPGAVELFDVPTVVARSAGTAPAADVAGDDVIDGDGGQDVVLAQSGDDLVRGGADDDDLAGNAGADDVLGGDGADEITGGSRTAGVVDDQLRSRTADARTWNVNDVLDGGAGADLMAGDNATFDSSGVVPLDVPLLGELAGTAGTYGPDVLLGRAGEDVMLGQSGDDQLEGGDDHDVMQGNSGRDFGYGQAGDDYVYGGSNRAGVDDADVSVDGVPTGDHLEGGDGNDTVLGDNGLIETGVTLTLPLVGTVGSATVVTEHDVEWSGKPAYPLASGADEILGQGGRDRLFGQGKTDAVSGGGDDDEVSGGSAADSLLGDAGADDIVGGSGQAEKPADMAQVLDGADQVDGGAGADVAIGDNGKITRPSGATDPNTGAAVRTVVQYDVEKLGGPTVPTGARGGDTLRGGTERDLLYGQGGDDTLEGGDGDDWMEGNHGADRLTGGNDDDDLVGGSSAKGVTSSTVTGLVGTPGQGGFPAPTNLLDGADRLWGDAGNDAALGDNGHVVRPVDGAGRWTYATYLGQQLLKRQPLGPNQVEPATTYGNDVAHGGTGHDEVHGQLGDDVLEGNEGDDVVLGDLGKVTTSVNGGPARTINANGFIAATILEPGTLLRSTELYPLPTSADDQRGGGKDVIAGGLGDDVLHGGAAADQVWGNRELDAADQPVVGTTGSATADDEDAIFGGHGDDVMWGGPDHDRMYGGHGADLLDLVTNLRGDPTVDFVGVDHMYGGWGPDGMQADVSQPSPSHGTDKMVDATGAYNGYFVCEGAYGGNSVMRTLSPAMEDFWLTLAASDGLVAPGTGSTSGWWELGMVYNPDRGKNSNPTYELAHPAHFICDATTAASRTR